MVSVSSSVLPNKRPFSYEFCLFSIKVPTDVGEIAKHSRKLTGQACGLRLSGLWCLCLWMNWSDQQQRWGWDWLSSDSSNSCQEEHLQVRWGGWHPARLSYLSSLSIVHLLEEKIITQFLEICCIWSHLLTAFSKIPQSSRCAPAFTPANAFPTGVWCLTSHMMAGLEKYWLFIF